MMNIREKAAKLIDGCAEVTLASVSEDGYPRPCVVSRIQSDGLNSFHAATGMMGTKVRHFKQNPKAGANFWDGKDNGVVLTGDVTIVEDMAIKRALWQDWFINHFPGGVEDPNYALLRFDGREATLWIDGEFETISVKEGL